MALGLDAMPASRPQLHVPRRFLGRRLAALQVLVLFTSNLQGDHGDHGGQRQVMLISMLFYCLPDSA